MRKIILSIIGILLIVASFFYAKKLIADKNKPKPVQAKVVKTVFTDTIQNNTIQIIIAANGSLEAKRRVEISLFYFVQNILFVSCLIMY